LLHAVIVVDYNDGTFDTWSFGPNGWENKNDLDKNCWGWWRTYYPGITGADINKICNQRRNNEDNWSITYNCQTGAGSALDEACKKNGVPNPDWEQTKRDCGWGGRYR
jgi:hypothetical protein